MVSKGLLVEQVGEGKNTTKSILLWDHHSQMLVNQTLVINPLVLLNLLFAFQSFF